MADRTRELWEKQHRLVGDRREFFSAVGEEIAAERVLYAGSYVDITPSLVWPSVAYVDLDTRAARFFDDASGVQELVAPHVVDDRSPEIEFVHGDYSDSLPFERESFDLLVSLYAGFVSEHCTEYLRVGGSLLANTSHGDVAMASLDPRYRLHGAVLGSGPSRVDTADLDRYLIPKRDVEITVDSLHRSGRGVEYTLPAFAYLFRRIA